MGQGKAALIWARLCKVLRLMVPRPSEVALHWQARRTGLFDAAFYRGAYPSLHPFYRVFAFRHYVVWGEGAGLRPNPDFCPRVYLQLNPDVATSGMRPFAHYLNGGHKEGRLTRPLPDTPLLPDIGMPRMRFDPNRKQARFAVLVHVYYPDLWPEFATRLTALDIDHDLFVTLTWRGAETEKLAAEIKDTFPGAQVFCLPNRGRDILPFVTLINAGAFAGYEAVCKIHTKKSPHRQDGAKWRTALIDGVLPMGTVLQTRLQAFMADPDAAIWVADGQCFKAADWWGSNQEKTAAVLRRVELESMTDMLQFPAGSIYWIKPLALGMIKALKLETALFETEKGQIDGTLAHAFERALGGLVHAGGQYIRQSSELISRVQPMRTQPRFVSAFYLPQFHPIPENDAWWGAGFTEWRATQRGVSMFPGHLQPMRPADLGYYDLRAPQAMGAQTALARRAGVDAFCVYHYWFDGRRVLETPLDNLLNQPDIDFPFYLCWANESWRRNWDGLSGEVLLDQSYAPGFEAALVASCLPYMRDARYARPDGTRPRFVLYRPEDMPDPDRNIARLRQAWREAGIGEVELGAVSFHIAGSHSVAEDAFDFWVEMPPHGLVQGEDYLFGGALGNRMGTAGPTPDFGGLIYDYRAVADRSLTAHYRKGLPKNTIAGIMPSWDNTARRGAQGHIAHGGNPATFRAWLQGLQKGPLAGSYRQELFINAWNEWAEKAMLEPSETFGQLNLDVLSETTQTTASKDETQRLRAHG
jgi:lipopolysaccharide biosynthesis protein